MNRMRAALLVAGLGVLATPLPASADHPSTYPWVVAPDVVDCTGPGAPPPPDPLDDPAAHYAGWDGTCHYSGGPD